MKKRVLALFLSLLLLCLSGCGGNGDKIAALQEEIIALREENAVLKYRLSQYEPVEGVDAAPAAAAEMAAEEAALESAPTDAQSMPQPEAAQLREEISTLEQVKDFFDSRYPEIWMSAHLNDGVNPEFWLAAGEEILLRDPACESVGRSCIAQAATYLLGDDMEISTIIGFRHDANGGCPLMALNCIKTERGYRFVDLVFGMQGDLGSRYGALLPEAETATLEEYVELIQKDPAIFAELDNLYRFTDSSAFYFTERADGYAELISPGELLYHKEGSLSNEEFEVMMYGHIKPENIHAYALSGELGGLTLSPEEAYELVDAPPEEVQARVKTAGDLLMYMLAARIGDCGGCFCESFDGYTWHFNLTAYQVMEQKLGNCGSCANLANYLLKDDYEEIGIIQHAYYPGNGGGHVYNYILHQREYYIVDYSWYIFANYAQSNDFPILKLKALEDFPKHMDKLYGGVSMVIALTSEGQHLPNIFGEEFNDPHYYVPTGSEYTLLYEAGDGYLIGEMPLDKKYHDWTKVG